MWWEEEPLQGLKTSSREPEKSETQEKPVLRLVAREEGNKDVKRSEERMAKEGYLDTISKLRGELSDCQMELFRHEQKTIRSTILTGTFSFSSILFFIVTKLGTRTFRSFAIVSVVLAYFFSTRREASENHPVASYLNGKIQEYGEIITHLQNKIDNNVSAS